MRFRILYGTHRPSAHKLVQFREYHRENALKTHKKNMNEIAQVNIGLYKQFGLIAKRAFYTTEYFNLIKDK